MTKGDRVSYHVCNMDYDFVAFCFQKMFDRINTYTFVCLNLHFMPLCAVTDTASTQLWHMAVRNTILDERW